MSYAAPTSPRLTRPREGRMIAGVCAGIANRFGWSPTTVRIVFVLSCLLPGPQFLLYLALWVIVPKER
ncbi:PspC domain-containing protein [Yinghuangia sp. ASG 101]|uniref:PspC domain-containing protein n=1 Tax=Yinghuangia sp. ASG 101 TaxID=2896848 RepID=UPI001E326EC1|nr:PspC domain-containing protein [Yinghuangia sp. ASG 101]UGQ14460.1 PspC domain-containing protein [Yinghuangia sp. ASG 101]